MPFTPRVKPVPVIVAMDPGATPIDKLVAFTVADSPGKAGLGSENDGAGPAHPISIWRYHRISMGASCPSVSMASQGDLNVNRIVSVVAAQTGVFEPLVARQTVRLLENVPLGAIGPVPVNQLGWPAEL